jgi:transposase
LTTKIHACVDALGNPLRLILTAGQMADVTQGAALVEAIATDAVIADKGYDSDALVATIESTGAKAIIPPRSNRNHPRSIDWHRYKARNLVERFFCRLKQFRRLATRYDKLAKRFNAFLDLACAYIWLLGTGPNFSSISFRRFLLPQRASRSPSSLSSLSASLKLPLMTPAEKGHPLLPMVDNHFSNSHALIFVPFFV